MGDILAKSVAGVAKCDDCGWVVRPDAGGVGVEKVDSAELVAVVADGAEAAAHVEFDGLPCGTRAIFAVPGRHFGENEPLVEVGVQD